MKPTKEALKILTAAHIARYSGRLKAAQEQRERTGHADGYRVDELIGYLSLWREVEAADFDWAALRPEVRAEVYDAIEDADG